MISTKKVTEKSVENLLSLTTEVDIFRFYLGEEFCIGCNIHSPLRNDDSNPSFQIFHASKGIRWKDFGTGKTGDFIEFVKEKFSLSFNKALDKIYSDLGLIKEQSVPYYVFPGIQPKREIKIKKRSFNQFDLDFWKQFGINEKILKKYEVSALQKYWLIEGNKEKIFTANKFNPVYSYHFGDYLYRLYSPFSDSFKWLTNAGSEILQGWNQLPMEGQKVILTSSLKDVMLLNSLGYTSIAPQSENTIIPERTIAELMNRFEEIIVFFNNDSAGIEGAKRYERYDFKSVILPKNCLCKDPSDYFKAYGLELTTKILKELL